MRIKERTLNLTSPFKTSFGYAQGPSSGTTTTMVERIQNGNDILSYTYDDLGNIETISENGELKVTYTYDKLSQLVREDNLYQNQTITYTYDTGGNILRRMYYAYCTGDLETEGDSCELIVGIAHGVLVVDLDAVDESRLLGGIGCVPVLVGGLDRLAVHLADVVIDSVLVVIVDPQLLHVGITKGVVDKTVLFLGNRISANC